MEEKAEAPWGAHMTTVAAQQQGINSLIRDKAMQAMTQLNTGYGASLGQAINQEGLAPRRVNISITDAENGRIVQVGSRTYVVSEGSSLIGVIGSALVELKLEN